MIATAAEFPNSTGGYRGQQFRYDLMGRVNYASNPTETTGSYPNWQAAGDDTQWYYTQQAYDWQGRPTITTNVDYTTRQVSYEGCGCAGGETVTVQDEAGRRQKVYHDVLGRTVKGEVLNPNGSVYATTKTTYNLRNQATKVRQYQGDESSSAYQDSDLSYDGYGRLASRKAPVETSATTYLYNADDTVQRRTDPRGAYQTFSYNARHLLMSVTNTKPPTGSPGSEESGPLAVPKAADTSFSYDEAGNRTAMVENINGASFGTMSYSYNSLSRLTAETRYYAPLNQSFTLSYTYNLAGAVKTLTDPFNSVVTYDYNKVGEMTGVNATGYPNVSTFASNIRYRAWGAMKQMTYHDGTVLTQSYNNKLLLTQYKLQYTGSPSIANFQYYNDGRVKTALDPAGNDRFDRAYSYDDFGRLTQGLSGRAARAFANGQQPPNPDPNDPDPYLQNYGYNAFNHLTNRNNTFWNQQLTPYVGTYVNDRQQSWNYDAAGNVKDDSEGNHYTFNTASQMTYWNSSSNGTIAQTYDGDGQAGYRQESHYNPYTQTPYNSTRYYIRSSVLGGQVVAEVNESGQRRKRHVYGTGGEIGRETYQTYSQQYVAGLVFRNPITGDSTDGTTDPLGGLMPPEDAYATNPNPDYFGMLGDRDSHSADADPFEPSGGCTLDGIPINCDVAIGLANHGGAAVAPLKRVQAVTYQGRSVLAYWNAYGDGYEGFVPLSARYVGGGQFRPYGAPQLLGRGTTARYDTDFRELNGVSEDDPEAQLARSSPFAALSGSAQTNTNKAIDWFKQVVINQTLKFAEKALENSKCNEFLKGGDTDPLTKLKDLNEKGFFKPGKPTFNKPDGTQGNAIADTSGAIADSFFFHSVAGVMYEAAPARYLTSLEARVLVILHEIGHITKAPGQNHYSKHINGRTYVDSNKSRAYDKSILENCLPTGLLKKQ